MPKSSVISIKGLTNRFGKQTVHKDLSLDIDKGEIMGIIGGSGSGKSVLLKTIIGLIRPVSGTINLLGVNILDADDEDLTRVRKRTGVLFQDGALFSSLNVSENIQAPLREFGVSLGKSFFEEISALKLAMVGLPPETAYKYPSELSGGMRKRAGLARALALDADILFLDEPTAGLDPIAAASFDELTLNLRKLLGCTVFLVTHDLDTIWTVCDRVAVLAEKRIYAVGTIPELLKVDQPWIKQYFSGPRGRAAARSHEAK